jgi:APA family basic amino acid/polyamine antiporter
MVPVAGSAYTYSYATLGEVVAWIIGWDLVLEYAIGSSVVASGWSNYFNFMFRYLFKTELDPRILWSPWYFDTTTHQFLWKKVAIVSSQGPVELVNAWFNLPAAALTLVITAVLVIGIRESTSFNAGMVLLNLAVILFVIGVGVFYVDTANYTPFFHKKHGWWGVFRGAGQMFFAYIGFDSISTHAEEARSPQRDLPIGIIASLLICTILYIAVALVLTGMVPYAEIDTHAPLSEAFNRHELPSAAVLIAIGILAGITSSLLVGMLSQARILLAMARDGMLPHSIFGAVHERFKTPWKSTIVVGIVVALGAALAPLDFLADLVSIGTLSAFILVCAAVWLLRVKSPEIERPFRAPALPVVASLGIVINGAVMISLGVDTWIRFLVWMVLGLAIYFGYSRRHTKFGKNGETPAQGV